MAITICHEKYRLQFTFTAGTSRGVMKDRDTYILKVADSDKPDLVGLGECAPLPGLSMEYGPQYEEALAGFCEKMQEIEQLQNIQEIPMVLDQYVTQMWPSIYFGFEMAFLDLLKGGRNILFENGFTKGKESLPINGLIWMGNREFMRKQIEEKVNAGYTCLKMKVGALDFDQEVELLTYLRQLVPTAILRVDANGAFSFDEAQKKLHLLEHLNVHSIEQPLQPSRRQEMQQLCLNSPIPIALDEELIGVCGPDKKRQLLEEINPQYLVLKPTLLGGFHATGEWIQLAEELGIGWWITSALESNVGLNAISQFTASQTYKGHQGLGTGQLFSNNFDADLSIERGRLYYAGAG